MFSKEAAIVVSFKTRGFPVVPGRDALFNCKHGPMSLIRAWSAPATLQTKPASKLQNK